MGNTSAGLEIRFGEPGVGPRKWTLKTLNSNGGSPIPNTEVSITGPGGFNRIIITNDSGEFDMDILESGVYTIIYARHVAYALLDDPNNQNQQFSIPA